MNAVDYLKAKTRMTEKCDIPCSDCPLNDPSQLPVGCEYLESEEPERAVEIVEKWQKENQFRVPKDTPIDAKVFCSDLTNPTPDSWSPRHFAGFENGRMMAWMDGHTSHTTKAKTPWKYMRLAE